MYHFDLEHDQVDQLLNNPQGFLQDLGLGAEQGIAPNGNVSVVTNFNQQWTGRRWERRDVSAELAPTRPTGCCYVSDDSVICHVHG